MPPSEQREKSFGKKNLLPIIALLLVLTAGVFILAMPWLNLSFVAFVVVLLPIAGFFAGIAGLISSIFFYRALKDRAYIWGIAMSGIAIALPVLAVVLPILLLNAGVISLM
ncbi:MAG: hypothetical protein FWD58_08740 [Firmicutes bacterium]|nr:hypothetical protein [Bacillota bacterium]